MARLFLAVLGEPDSRLLLDVLERADWDFSLGVRHGSDPRTVAVLEVLMASLGSDVRPTGGLDAFDHLRRRHRIKIQPISSKSRRALVGSARAHQLQEGSRASRRNLADASHTPERRRTVGRIENVARALPHLRDKLEAEARHALATAVSRFLELGLRLRLDQEPCGHLALSLDSMRSNTSSAGLPCDCPDFTRSARCAISAAHSSARLATDSLGAMASTTTRRSSSDSSDARAMSLRTAAVDTTKSCSLQPRMSRRLAAGSLASRNQPPFRTLPIPGAVVRPRAVRPGPAEPRHTRLWRKLRVVKKLRDCSPATTPSSPFGREPEFGEDRRRKAAASWGRKSVQE